MAKIKSVPNPKNFRYRHKPRSVSTSAFERAYWPYLPLLLVVGVLFSLVVRGGAFANLSHPGEKVLGYATSMNINKLTGDTNTQRVKDGLAPLKLSPTLDAAAEAKAQNMVNLDYWSHDAPNGNPPWVFVADENYSYQELGENLAAGFDSESSVVNAWMASAEHRANILNQAYSQVGFGVAQSANFTAAGGGPMTIVVAYYAEPAPAVTLASALITDGHKPVSAPPASTTSHAQLALAGSRMADKATKLTILLIVIASILWIARHARSVRRFIKKGQRLAVAHPLIDLCFIAIVFLAYLMTQTAGFIK